MPGPFAALTARNVQVTGNVADLFDFDLEAAGCGFSLAHDGAKIQIASVKHDIGKVFVVSLDMDFTIESFGLVGSRPGN